MYDTSIQHAKRLKYNVLKINCTNNTQLHVRDVTPRQKIVDNMFSRGCCEPATSTLTQTFSLSLTHSVKFKKLSQNLRALIVHRIQRKHIEVHFPVGLPLASCLEARSCKGTLQKLNGSGGRACSMEARTK